jgi:outer membrane protein with beta-barrel domain
MSRNVTLALLAVAVATPLCAGAQLTFKAGASFASTSESELVPDVSNKTGLAVGVGFGFKFGNGTFALHPELLYVQKGGDLGASGDLKIDELDVPLLAQFNLSILESLSPFLYAGPQAEFELSCTAADTDCVDTESLRWGGVVGLGVGLGQRFTGELRYNWTFNNISDALDSKPRTILLLAGFHFK